MCFLVLGSFRAYAQSCVIDGVIIPDSLLRVSVDEMRSDSAKQIVAKRLGFLSPFAIDTIRIFPKGKMQTFCREPADIILIQTNTLAQLQWVVNGKLKKPKKRLTIIDYKLSLRSSSAKRGKAEEDSFYTSIGAYGLYHQAGGEANRSCKNEKVGR